MSANGMPLVQVTGRCPHCEVRKHQIDGTQERALRIVGEAIDKHIREAHPEVYLTEPCNECNRDVPEDDAGPSCGAHVLHVECAPWFGCHECYLMRAEIP